MGRPKKHRFVRLEPDVDYFKPRGIPLSELEDVNLTVEEFEAIRLKDSENVEQKKAAKKMKVSQSTFHRIYASARKKLAEAIVKGKAIKIQGGIYKMPGRVRGTRAGGPSKCVCPNCGHKEAHVRGIPCTTEQCPKCDTRMIGKW